VRFGRIAGGFVVAALAFMGRSLLGDTTITVPNGSFESPSVPLAQIASPVIDSWTATGGNNTGIFPNLPQDENFGGVVAKRITNADGLQLAFIGAQYDPTGTTDNGTPVINEIYQQLIATYQPGQTYTLSIGVTTSSVQPPSPGSVLRVELYYPGTGGSFQPVAFTLVSSDAATGADNALLKYFTVQTPAVVAGAPYANQPIGILLATTDNSPATGGTFDMDNVTLVAAVPEPGSVMVLALTPLALLRRRR